MTIKLDPNDIGYYPGKPGWLHTLDESGNPTVRWEGRKNPDGSPFSYNNRNLTEDAVIAQLDEKYASGVAIPPVANPKPLPGVSNDLKPRLGRRKHLVG